MRLRILRTLLHKEMLRHLADRGGLVLSLLLVCMALLLSFGKSNQQAGPLTGDLARVYVVYAENDPRADELRAWHGELARQAPPEFRAQLRFMADTDRRLPKGPDGRFVLENAGLIKIVSDGTDPASGGPRFKAEFWYPGDDN